MDLSSSGGTGSLPRTTTVMLLVALGSCAGQGTGEERTAQMVESEVETFLGAYRTAIDAKQIERLRTMYVDDGRFRWIEDGQVRYRSPEDVMAALAALPNDAGIQTEYENTEVTVVGTRSASAGSTFRTTMGEGPSAYSFGGMITMVLEQGAEGWRIVEGHTSSFRDQGR